jgi:hypothetical protein
MKQENEERFVVNIPSLAIEQLDELRTSVYPVLRRGQMAALAITEKHQRDISPQKNSPTTNQGGSQ